MSKYNRVINKDGKHLVVDVYDVIDAFNVTCPALQHLVKKALCVGIRGHKDESQDLQDILDSAERAISLAAERADGEIMKNTHSLTVSDDQLFERTMKLYLNSINEKSADAFAVETQAKLGAAESDQFDLSNDESVNEQVKKESVIDKTNRLVAIEYASNLYGQDWRDFVNKVSE